MSEQDQDNNALREIFGIPIVFSGTVGGVFGYAIGQGIQGALIGGGVGVGLVPCVVGTGIGGYRCAEPYLEARRIRQEREESDRAYIEMNERNRRDIPTQIGYQIENPDGTYSMAILDPDTVRNDRNTGTIINLNPLLVAPQTQEFEPAEPEGRITGEEFKKGGFVKRTGLAKVHRGEYVVPKSKIKKCNVCK